jgi:hypothetical protein
MIVTVEFSEKEKEKRPSRNMPKKQINPGNLGVCNTVNGQLD